MNQKCGSARLATYGLRPDMRGGSALPRKAAVLADHSFEGDKGNMPLQKGYAGVGRKGRT